MKNKYPNVLVISNNSLSENNSNGRTLSGFLRGWSKENIAQIYISGELPESEVCDRFYQITDKSVLKGVFCKKNVGMPVANNYDSQKIRAAQSLRAVKKSILKLMLRDLLWSSNVWWNKKLKEWILEFSPDIILFFAGESKFTYKIALKIADFCNLPIVVYNSEGYYFKEKNYLKNGSVFSDAIYPFFHTSFKRIFKKLMYRSVHAIYINDKLKSDYDKEFNMPSTTIYTASNVKECRNEEQHSKPQVSYLGNLGVGRHLALIEIAKALNEINKDYKLDIYGKITNEQVKKAFDECPEINYCGMVPYREVISIMHKSDLLVHGESFNDFYCWDLKYAFTTKIADSLSCGTCFFVYAPESLACTEYLIKNKCACVVTDRRYLKKELYRILNDEGYREQYVENALKIADKNHNSDLNCEIFQRILIDAVKEKNYENNAN